MAQTHVTSLASSEPRPSTRTFFNDTTPIKRSIEPSIDTSPYLDIESVRRLLNFTAPPNVSAKRSFEVFDQKTADAKYKLPTHLKDEYYSLAKRIGKSLQSNKISPYYISLNPTLDIGESYLYAIYIIVSDEFIKDVCEIIASIPTKYISIRVLEGDFSPSALPLVVEDWGLEDRPTPGRSIGPDVGDISAIKKTQVTSGTLGGYVIGTTTGRIFGLTVGHLVFPKPTKDPLQRRVRIVQPSDYEYLRALTRAEQFMNDAAPDAKDAYRAKYESLKSIEHERYLGTVIHASWTTIPAPFGAPQLTDFALIQVDNARLGSNRLRLPSDCPFVSIINGAAVPRTGESIMKIGKATGYSEGVVWETKAFIYHDDFGGEVCLEHTHNMAVDKGDSGSFIINGSCKVVGLLVGAVKEKKMFHEHGEVFSQGCFIAMDDALRWCSKVLGEPVEILKTGVSMNYVP